MRLNPLLAVAAALVFSPAVSFALPIQCTDVCSEPTYCDEPCFVVMRASTCGASGYACFPPDSAPASSGDELAATCADCATERTACLRRVKYGDIEEIQACNDAYTECSQLYCVSAQ
ncbi:hypothetical protein JYK02_10620 [Corallococcus macrosporus]|uniref:Uncharacterized protein n=1 Tax=Corallococcus macrosporus TaxID=35 RepID=A0ABS3D8I4_9BACT|nr:hypothetical protein [Corallococcus macrosporus]MBN8227962.1 hypothetical protein [Corallococcus macrosporus]